MDELIIAQDSSAFPAVPHVPQWYFSNNPNMPPPLLSRPCNISARLTHTFKYPNNVYNFFLH